MFNSLQIAEKTMEDVSVMMAPIWSYSRYDMGPREATYKARLDILQNMQEEITIEELSKTACNENEQIEDYLVTLMENKVSCFLFTFFVITSHTFPSILNNV